MFSKNYYKIKKVVLVQELMPESVISIFPGMD